MKSADYIAQYIQRELAMMTSTDPVEIAAHLTERLVGFGETSVEYFVRNDQPCLRVEFKPHGSRPMDLKFEFRIGEEEP